MLKYSLKKKTLAKFASDVTGCVHRSNSMAVDQRKQHSLYGSARRLLAEIGQTWFLRIEEEVRNVLYFRSLGAAQ